MLTVTVCTLVALYVGYKVGRYTVTTEQLREVKTILYNLDQEREKRSQR